jgi:heme-degrading monooxygenase HmoA
MMTVVTTTTLREGATDEWDGEMHARVEAARDRKGWVAAQLLKQADRSLNRAIVGTWESREAWAEWHDDPVFRETRERLADLQEGPSVTVWFEVVESVG